MSRLLTNRPHHQPKLHTGDGGICTTPCERISNLFKWFQKICGAQSEIILFDKMDKIDFSVKENIEKEDAVSVIIKLLRRET